MSTPLYERLLEDVDLNTGDVSITIDLGKLTQGVCLRSSLVLPGRCGQLIRGGRDQPVWPSRTGIEVIQGDFQVSSGSLRHPSIGNLSGVVIRVDGLHMEQVASAILQVREEFPFADDVVAFVDETSFDKGKIRNMMDEAIAQRDHLSDFINSLRVVLEASVYDPTSALEDL